MANRFHTARNCNLRESATGKALLSDKRETLLQLNVFQILAIIECSSLYAEERHNCASRLFDFSLIPRFFQPGAKYDSL